MGAPVPPTAGGGPPTRHAPSTSNPLATASLVLGIAAVVTAASILGGVVCGSLAVVFGVLSRRDSGGRRDGGPHTAPRRRSATAGVVLGTVGLTAAAALVLTFATGHVRRTFVWSTCTDAGQVHHVPVRVCHSTQYPIGTPAPR